MQYKTKIYPQKLKKGDTIGIVAPAGNIRNLAQIEKVKCYFNKKGYKVKISQGLYETDRYLAGEDKLRASELMKFFLDDEVNAIVCARGGYGTYRILDMLDYDLIRKNPKIFVGYSDITALHSAIAKKSNLVTFHGPLALSDFGVDEVDEYTEKVFFDILEKNDESSYIYKNTENYTCINKGQANGELFAGNLTVLCGLLGTPYFPELKNKILILEEIAEPLYKIDRMLTQLKLSGVLQQVKGILFANFTDMPDFEDEETKTKEICKFISEVLSDFTIPMGYGFPASHAKKKATLPVGRDCIFCADNHTLEIN